MSRTPTPWPTELLEPWQKAQAALLAKADAKRLIELGRRHEEKLAAKALYMRAYRALKKEPRDGT